MEKRYLKNSFKTMVLVFMQWPCILSAQTRKTSLVNVFLGTSGDHGQLSPGASSPFGMMDIAPQTYPNTHTGYEHRAKLVLGFTHNRLEGVGCMGSGGNLEILMNVTTPFRRKLTTHSGRN